jgi:hypothetical protein
MTTLTTKLRKSIPASQFALPEQRAYPIEDKAHARNAKARAHQAERAGRLSKTAEAAVDKKADAVLRKD